MRRISGKNLLSSLELKARSFGADVEALEKKIAQKEREIATANKQREDAYVELAGFYADEYEKVKTELVSVSGVIQGIFDDKAKRRLAVEADMDRFRQLISQRQDELAKAREGRDRAAAERDQLIQKVDGELQADAAFQEIRKQRQWAAEKLTEEIAASRALALEVADKLAHYDQHFVFRYLIRQRYGEREYRGKGLTARVDAWLAEKVTWTKNSINYAILKELPGYAERRVGDAERTLAALEARCQLRLQEGEQKHGLIETRAKYERRCHTIEAFEKQSAELESQLEAVTRERNSLQFNQDPFVKKAKDAIRTTLCSETLHDLRARAQRTPDSRDDRLVATIEVTEVAVNRGRDEVKDLRAQYVDADKQRARAQAVRRKFASEFTGTYDRFDEGFDVGSLLQGFILGQVTESIFWSTVNSRYYDATPHYTSNSPGSGWSGGSSDNSSSFGGGGSSFGGGDSGGGASFGGGDSGGGASFGGGD